MADLESLLHFLDETFDVSGFPDYPNALNGLQVEGPGTVKRLAVAVDASEVTILAAVEREADLLLVHHGIFWDGFTAITGPRYRKVRALLAGGTGLYGLHLPLDAHPAYGNCALLTRAMQLAPDGPFGDFQGRKIGWTAAADLHREELKIRLTAAVGGAPRLIPGGPENVRRLAVVTGGAASSLREAAAAGVDALITGEGAHHHFHEAMELGMNLYLAGHYATETFGVKAVGELLAARFGLEWTFLDFPTGL